VADVALVDGAPCPIAPPAMRQWIVEADLIFLETGLSRIYFAEIKRLNPNATVAYRASTCFRRSTVRFISRQS
jgi:hypothetical protein